MDLVEKLREIHAVGRIEDCAHTTQVCKDAADEIDRLRLSIEKKAQHNSVNYDPKIISMICLGR